MFLLGQKATVSQSLKCMSISNYMYVYIVQSRLNLSRFGISYTRGEGELISGASKVIHVNPYV